MKKLMMIVALIMTTIVAAQPGDRQRKMPNAEIQAKRMTLALDLNDSQEEKVFTILSKQQEQMKSQRLTKEERQKLTAEQKQNLAAKVLDQKISMKREFKSILTDEQYDQWEKMMAKRAKGKMKKRKSRRS